MVSLDETVALLYGANRRVGPLSADLTISQPTSRHRATGGVIRWRVTQDGPRYRWELLSNSWSGRRRGSGPPSLLVSDGTQAWAQYDDRVVVTPYQGCLVSDRLLDPSWLLARYDLSVGASSMLAGRRTVLLSGARKSVRRGPDGVPESIEAVVDAEHGFLHRFAGFDDNEPIEVLELSDLRFDVTADDSVFTLTVPAGHRVLDRTTGHRRHLWPRRVRADRRIDSERR